MSGILPRLLSGAVEKFLRLFPVVVLTGARQTGKSTLVRDLEPLSKRTYVTLDTALNRSLAAAEPQTLLNQATKDRITIDGVQRTPELLLAIKESVDQNKGPGRFLLTGSANLLLMQKVSESLAGRARYLTLWPMTRQEQLGRAACGIWDLFFTEKNKAWLNALSAAPSSRESWKDLAVRGGYPAAALLHPSRTSDSDRDELFTGYTQTYLERDLRDFAAIDNLYDFQRLMRAACLRLGSVINQVELARDTGLPRTTVQRYLNLLEISYQLVRLEPYSVNRSKRLIKSPKLYWSDTGLALHLAQLDAPTGAHLENIVCTDLLAWREIDTARPAILYWRTSSGAEVDFLIERKGKLLPSKSRRLRTRAITTRRDCARSRTSTARMCWVGYCSMAERRRIGLQRQCWLHRGGRGSEAPQNPCNSSGLMGKQVALEASSELREGPSTRLFFRARHRLGQLPRPAMKARQAQTVAIAAVTLPNHRCGSDR